MIDLSNFKSNFLSKKLQGIILWRYMSIEELQDILENKVLQLTPALKFEDHWEGHIPLKWVKNWYKKLFSMPDAAEIDDNFAHYYVECVKHNTFIKCFHNAEIESEIMWRSYSPKGKGVAIQINSDELSSPVHLYKPHDLNCRVVPITYVPVFTEDNPVMKPETMYLFKRKEFEHEKEVRIIGQNVKKVVEDHNQIVGNFYRVGQWDTHLLIPDFGQSVPIEPNHVIQSIVVNPFDDGQIAKSVIALVNKYRFRNPVRHSVFYGKKKIL